MSGQIGIQCNRQTVWKARNIGETVCFVVFTTKLHIAPLLFFLPVQASDVLLPLLCATKATPLLPSSVQDFKFHTIAWLRP